MPMIRAMRMLNAVEVGTTSGAQLETLLTDPGRLGEWNVLLGMRGQTRRMIASSTAMAAVAASSTAMAAVAASSTAMAAVAASSTAMAAVAASSTAMAAVAASSTARLAVFNSDSALTAIGSSAVAKTALRTAAGYTIKRVSNSTSAVTIGFTGNVIMVGFSSSNANGDTTIGGRRAGSVVGSLTINANQTPVDTSAGYDNVMALTLAATTRNSWSPSTHYFGVLPV